MKKFLIISLLIIIALNCKAQTNLVPNYSFDIYDTCPWGMTQIKYAVPWFQPFQISTSDYYDTCSNYMNFMNCQHPRTGGGYAGISMLEGDNWREYIEVKLNSSLIINKTYCVKFYVSLAGIGVLTRAIDAIGMFFSTDSLLKYAPIADSMLILRNPQIENPSGNIITDTINWVEISGNFVADSNYNFVTIGNFKDKFHTHYIDIGNPDGLAYYLIDDVSVYECDDTIIPPKDNELTISNAFTPNGDNINDFFHVKGQNIKNLHGSIINRWGQELFKWDDVNGGWDGKHDGLDVSAGVYYYIISVTFDNGEVQEKHGSLELVR